MKCDVVGIGTPISKKDLKELTKETKETLAVELKTNEQNRVFGSIDLWYAQKRHYASASRTRRLN